MNKEYYIVANSNASPFFSDESTSWVIGIDPEFALLSFVENYKHPAGLFAANLYKDANACFKGKKPLAKWRSFKALSRENETGGVIVK